MTNAEKNKAFRVNQIASGKCIWCANFSETDCGLCIPCRNKNRVKARNRYRLRHQIPLERKPWSWNARTRLPKIN